VSRELRYMTVGQESDEEPYCRFSRESPSRVEDSHLSLGKLAIIYRAQGMHWPAADDSDWAYWIQDRHPAMSAVAAAVPSGDVLGIKMTPGVRGGRPVLEGTRFPVARILAELADGMTVRGVAREYALDLDKVKRALLSVAAAVESGQLKT